MSSVYFNPVYATKYGVGEAILIENFQFWIGINQGNGVNLHEGRTWSFMTQQQLSDKFPFFKKKKIERLLESLCAQGIIIKGRFNKRKNDRTTWYAFNNETEFIPNKSLKILKGQNRDIDFPELEHPPYGNDPALPDIKQNNKTNYPNEGFNNATYSNKKSKFELIAAGVHHEILKRSEN